MTAAAGTFETNGFKSPATDVVAVRMSWHVSPLTYMLMGNGYTKGLSRKYDADLLTCLSRRGWEHSPLPGVLTESAPSTIGGLVRYRRVYGYGIGGPTRNPADLTDFQLMRNMQVYLRTLSRSQRRSYHADVDADGGPGTPQARRPGCEPTVMKHLFLGLPIENSSFYAAYQAAMSRVASSLELRSADRRWATCMVARGLTGLRTPSDALTLIVRQATTERGTELHMPADEVPIATVDISCELTTVLPVQHALELAAAGRLARAFPRYASRVSQ